MTVFAGVPFTVKSLAWTVAGFTGVAQIDNEVRRLGVDDAVAGRSGGGHGKTHQLSIGEGILLGCAADGHAPVIP